MILKSDAGITSEACLLDTAAIPTAIRALISCHSLKLGFASDVSSVAAASTNLVTESMQQGIQTMQIFRSSPAVLNTNHKLFSFPISRVCKKE